MRLFFATDMHGQGWGEGAFPEVDGVVLGGDLTAFGTVEDVRRVVRSFLGHGVPVLAVLGNCDPPAAEGVLREMGVECGLAARAVGEAVFVGIGGSNLTPFRTPHEWGDAAMAAMVASLSVPASSLPLVVVSHSPPFGSGADRVPGGGVAGSRAVADLVRRLRPAAVLCGHIHEAVGVFDFDGVPVINPGAFRAGHYALVELGAAGRGVTARLF